MVLTEPLGSESFPPQEPVSHLLLCACLPCQSTRARLPRFSCHTTPHGPRPGTTRQLLFLPASAASARLPRTRTLAHPLLPCADRILPPLPSSRARLSRSGHGLVANPAFWNAPPRSPESLPGRSGVGQVRQRPDRNRPPRPLALAVGLTVLAHHAQLASLGLIC